jgi:hypothetical protein
VRSDSVRYSHIRPAVLLSLYLSLSPQVEDYGHWIPQDPAGKKRERRRILRKSSGNRRKWKQYSDQKFIGFFPVDSSQFPVLSGKDRSEIIGKNPKNFRWEYCFHVPAISGAFLPEPARNFRPGLIEHACFFSYQLLLLFIVNTQILLFFH